MRLYLSLSYFIAVLPLLTSSLFTLQQFIYYIPLNPLPRPLSLSFTTFTPLNTGMTGKGGGVRRNEKRKGDWESSDSEMVVGETRKRGDIRSGRNGHKTEKSLPIPFILLLPFSYSPPSLHPPPSLSGLYIPFYLIVKWPPCFMTVTWQKYRS